MNARPIPLVKNGMNRFVQNLPVGRELREPEVREAHAEEPERHHRLDADPGHEGLGHAPPRGSWSRRWRGKRGRPSAASSRAPAACRASSRKKPPKIAPPSRAPTVFATATGRMPEDPERHERRVGSELPPEKGGDQHDGERREADRLRRGPAVVRRLRHRVDERDEPGGDQRPRRPDRCDGRPPRPRPSEIKPRGEGEDRDPDGHVDEEDPLPAEVLDEDPAEQDARRRTASGDRAPDPERLVPLRAAVPEGGADDRERRRGDDRGAEALVAPGRGSAPCRSTTVRTQATRS